jgi:hypothetical protein
MPAPRFRVHLAVLLAYTSVALLFAWPLPARMSDAFPGDPSGDTGVYVWNLWVFRHEILAHHEFPFLTREILAFEPVAVPLSLHNYTTFANLVALPLVGRFGVAANRNIA